MARETLLVLDTSCFSHIEPAESRARFVSSVRISRLAPRASELNLLEAVQTGFEGVRARLLATMRSIHDGLPLLPWPYWLVHRAGEALVAGEAQIVVGDTGKEWLLDNPPDVAAEREKAIPFVDALEADFEQAHTKGRPGVQRFLKSKKMREPWGNARAFLDEYWAVSDIRAEVARLTWRKLDLPGEAPIEELRQVPIWNLFLDAEGVAMYERAFVHEELKRVHRLDLMQLVYMAGPSMSILATNDKPLLRAASAVLHGRYAGARAIAISDIIA